MRLPRLTEIPAALRDPRRLGRWVAELLVLIALVGAVSLWQNRGLPEGPAPALAGIRTDGSVVSVGVASSQAGVPPAGGGEPDLRARGGENVGAGGTARLVVFWAIWCGVCKAEAGNIESVARDWPVISVAMQSGDADAVRAHLAERGLTVPALVDADGTHAAAWRLRGVPTHFILDPAGNIRFRVVGYATTLGLRARLWWAQRFPL